MVNILIAEDEQPIADLITMALRRAGYRCTWAADGERAADLAASHPYDLALVDVMLPGADGFALLEYFQSLDLPVIFVTGLRADPRARKVWRGDQEIALTPKEFDLMLLFLRNPNAALYRDTIYERVWGGELAFGSKTVDLHVQRLRKKVGWETQLRAVNKIGYRLEVPE